MIRFICFFMLLFIFSPLMAGKTDIAKLSVGECTPTEECNVIKRDAVPDQCDEEILLCWWFEFSGLAGAIEEDILLVSPFVKTSRRLALDEQVRPYFYQAYVRTASGQIHPLNAFFLGELHDLPFEFLPCRVRQKIVAIASSEESYAFDEICGEEYSLPDDELEKKFDNFSLDHKISCGQSIGALKELMFQKILDEQRKSFSYLVDIYGPEEGGKRVEMEIAGYQADLKGGWARALGNEFNKLILLYEQLGEAPVRKLNEILDRTSCYSPSYVRERMPAICEDVVAELGSPQCSLQPIAQLDDQITDLFSKKNRPVWALEHLDDRDISAVIKVHEKVEGKVFSVSLEYDLENIRNAAKSALLKTAQESVESIDSRVLSLDDLDYRDKLLQEYISNDNKHMLYDAEDRERNRVWLKKIIKDLQQRRMAIDQGIDNPPCLFFFGRAHLYGEDGILQGLKANGFEPRRMAAGSDEYLSEYEQ